ncbi:hypothetical protein SAMN05216559_1105 [Halomicrobium zhouii]|uniref:Uncharacterized protein n=1 Tax=Halomicrobium zhouii TaxID=767519 RepID=A0A1I6KNM4_9EURY|nr:hypothetical protein SAMN05216559_1105 [Halomicrobium zhouii]
MVGQVEVVPVSERCAFTRASYLYDAEAGECVPWDWRKMQPIAESQREVERAVADVEGA